MRNVVPDYAGFAEQCRKLVTKMAGEHKEALRKWRGLGTLSPVNTVS
jgi:hypothetical protein